MVTGEIKEGIFKTKVSGGLKNKWLLQHHFINRISSVARTLWKHQSNLGLLKSFYMTQTLWIFFFLFLGTKPETIIQEVFVFLLADSCPQVKTLFRVGSYPTVSKFILFKTNLFSFPLTVSYTFTSTKWKTYPVARMYKNPYYLMQNYYSVHLVPSEKCEKETWVRKKLQISTERDFSPVFLLRLYIEFICYANYLLLFLYHFKSLFPDGTYLIMA